MGILKYHIRHIYRHFYYKFHERKNIIYLLFLLVLYIIFLWHHSFVLIENFV